MVAATIFSAVSGQQEGKEKLCTRTRYSSCFNQDSNLTIRPATYLRTEETRPAEYSNREQYLFYGHSSSSTSFIRQDMWPVFNLFISPLQLQLDFCILFLINIYLVNTAALHISDCSAQTAQDVVNWLQRLPRSCT